MNLAILAVIWTVAIYAFFVFIYCRDEMLAKKIEPKLILLLAVLLFFAVLMDSTTLMDSITEEIKFLVPFLAIWIGAFAALAATYQKRFLVERKLSLLLAGGFFSITSFLMIVSLLAGSTI